MEKGMKMKQQLSRKLFLKMNLPRVEQYNGIVLKIYNVAEQTNPHKLLKNYRFLKIPYTICEFAEHQKYAEAIKTSRKKVVAFKETRIRLKHLISNSGFQKEMFL